MIMTNRAKTSIFRRRAARASRSLLLVSFLLCGIFFCGGNSHAGDELDVLRSRQQQLDERMQRLQESMDKSLTRLDRIETQLKNLAGGSVKATPPAKKQAPPTARSGTKKQKAAQPAPPKPQPKKPQPPAAAASDASLKSLPPDLAASLRAATAMASDSVSGFGNGEWGLGANGKKVLDRFAASLAKKPNLLITVTGFGDKSKQGGQAKDGDLAWRRADAVSRYLIGKGIAEDAILTVNGESTARDDKSGRVEVVAWRQAP